MHTFPVSLVLLDLDCLDPVVDLSNRPRVADGHYHVTCCPCEEGVSAVFEGREESPVVADSREALPFALSFDLGEGCGARLCHCSAEVTDTDWRHVSDATGECEREFAFVVAEV